MGQCENLSFQPMNGLFVHWSSQGLSGVVVLWTPCSICFRIWAPFLKLKNLEKMKHFAILNPHFSSIEAKMQNLWRSGQSHPTVCVHRGIPTISPNKPNKLKVYASIKKSFSLENYVSCYNIAKRRNFTKLRISSHHLAIEKGRYTRPIMAPQENNVFAIIAQKKLLAMRCISFWGVQNLYLKGDVSFITLINYMA